MQASEPSVRLAEIIQSQWGNNRVAARVVHVDRVEKYVEAEGVFHDLETNSATLARVRRRISDKNNKVFTDDMIIVTGNAACSIAKRNAILGGVPKAIWRKAYEAAEGIVAGNIETLAITKEKLFKAFAAFGVKPELIFLAIGIGGADDVNLSHVPVLRGMYSALKSGEATVEEMFRLGRSGSADGDQRKSMKEGLSEIAGEKAGKTDAKKKKGEAPEGGQAEAAADQKTAEADAKTGEVETAEEGDDDDFPGDRPSLSEQARQRGRDARAKGMARKAVPPEYRDEARKVEAEAWLAGYDEAAKADKASKGAE